MSRITMIATSAGLLLAAAFIAGLVTPHHTVAGTDASNSSIQAAVPVYDLHVKHPQIKTMPVDDIPAP